MPEGLLPVLCTASTQVTACRQKYSCLATSWLPTVPGCMRCAVCLPSRLQHARVTSNYIHTHTAHSEQLSLFLMSSWHQWSLSPTGSPLTSTISTSSAHWMQTAYAGESNGNNMYQMPRQNAERLNYNGFRHSESSRARAVGPTNPLPLRDLHPPSATLN